MDGIPYGWIAWAALNTAAGHPPGYESAAAGAVRVAADTRAMVDLDAVYGPYTAVLGPALATVSGHAGSGHSALPAAVSVALAVLARSAATRRGTAP
jgi:hypothetical protein